MINYKMCFAQRFSSVNVYIANSYIERMDVIKTQMYNMDYVRSHYTTHIFSMDENYITNLYDSLKSLPLKEVNRDSIHYLFCCTDGRTTNEFFEPLIVIDFVIGERIIKNEGVLTFSVNRRGYVYKELDSNREIYYPNNKCKIFLEQLFPGMIFFRRD